MNKHRCPCCLVKFNTIEKTALVFCPICTHIFKPDYEKLKKSIQNITDFAISLTQAEKGVKLLSETLNKLGNIKWKIHSGKKEKQKELKMKNNSNLSGNSVLKVSLTENKEEPLWQNIENRLKQISKNSHYGSAKSIIEKLNNKKEN